MPKLSIVVLVYKTAKLLPRCLDSIIGQKGFNAADVEIVVVSDNSPDDVDEVMRGYRWPGISYVCRKVNGGEAKARNTGLRCCTGRYYTYVDSDDEVVNGYLETLLGIIDRHRPDIITYRYAIIDESGKRLGVSTRHREGLMLDASMSSGERARVFDAFGPNLRCNAVYRLDPIRGLRYREQYKLGIDGLFAFESYLRAKSFYVSNNVLYTYYQYASSATHNFTSRKLCDLMSIHRHYVGEIVRSPHLAAIRLAALHFLASNYCTWLLSEARAAGRGSEVDRCYRHTLMFAVESLCEKGLGFRLVFVLVKLALDNNWLVLLKPVRICIKIASRIGV